MAQFPGLSLTVQGNKMILRASTGKTDDRLIITKAVIGDGQLTASIDSLTEIVSKKLEIGLSKIKEVANGQMQLQFNFDNRNVANGFYWREVGLYAKNGDSGEEKLIGYSNAKGLTSYIPDKTNVIPMQRLVIALGVGDNPNVKGEVDFSSAITLEQLEEAINQHNTDNHAHDNRFNKYLPLAGGTVTGNVKFNNASVGFNNGNNTYDAKIRVASNGNFDIGVTEDNANKNATAQLLLHSQNKPKWYNSAISGKDIAMVEDINNAITAVDNDVALTKAPTLQLVKTLLSGLNIKNATDVINALETNKASGLGIRYDFSNPNAWYICLGKLFGNLIIQGGRRLNIKVYDYLQYQEQFPVSFSKNCFGVLVTLEGRGSVSGVSVSYTDKRTITGFTIVTDASNSEATSDLFYIALGI
jgi:hypothetical protein